MVGIKKVSHGLATAAVLLVLVADAWSVRAKIAEHPSVATPGSTFVL